MNAKLARKYSVIYADPPWRFKNYSVKGEGLNAVSHYDCMSVEQIKGLPVPDLAATDSCLFIWVTDPFLPRAFEVIEAWGFEYKTVGFSWAKLNKTADPEAMAQNDFFLGTGFWTRANAETCLLACHARTPQANGHGCAAPDRLTTP